MPELRIHETRIAVPPGTNLLQALLDAGQPVAYSCRAGACHACLLRAAPEQVPAQASANLSAELRQQGWLLSCQCPVTQDMELQLHNPAVSAVPARLLAADLLESDLLRLRLRPDVPLRYQPGQHLVIWIDAVLGRPYSIASQPGDDWLEFHLRLHADGRFSQAITRLTPGAPLWLGKPTGLLTYDAAWHHRPLLLLSRGTGLAPLQAVARQALNEGHDAPIDLWHWSAHGSCYLASEMQALAADYPNFTFEQRSAASLDEDLRHLRLASRAAIALVCGSPDFTERLRKPLFMAGLPGRQVIGEAFIAGAR